MIIANGSIFREDGKFHQGSIFIRDNKITEIQEGILPDNIREESRQEMIDAQGCYVIPGLVDIHLHGCAGYDFCDGTEEAIQAIVEYEAGMGVTSIVPATMTLSEEELIMVARACGKVAKENTVIKGITMEGPFISADKKGAQNALYIQKPDQDFFRRIQDASGGLVRQVAIAPEETGAMDFIKEISRECVVSVAHTKATYEEAQRAFTAGANHVTHLYNAMLPLGHREPGVVGAAFDNKNVYVELICDGEHVHPAVVRATFQMFGAERVCMISDSMRATGMPDGEYSLGGQQVWVKGKQAVLENGSLAGAVSTLYDNLKRVVLEMQIPLEEAVLACTTTPSKSLKIDNACGVLKVGRQADLVILNHNLDIKCVVKSGEKIRCE